MNNLAAAIQWNFFHSFLFTHDHVLQSQLVRESKRNCRVLSQMSLFVCECRLEKNFHKTDQRMYIACGCQLEKLILKCASASKQFLLLWFQFQYHDYFRFLLVFVMRFFIEYFRLWVIFTLIIYCRLIRISSGCPWSFSAWICSQYHGPTPLVISHTPYKWDGRVLYLLSCFECEQILLI